MTTRRTITYLSAAAAAAAAIAATSVTASADDADVPPTPEPLVSDVEVTSQDVDSEGNPIGPAITYDRDGNVISVVPPGETPAADVGGR